MSIRYIIDSGDLRLRLRLRFLQVDGREWELPPSPYNFTTNSNFPKNSQPDFPQNCRSDFPKNSWPYFSTDSNISTTAPQLNHCLRANRWSLNLKINCGRYFKNFQKLDFFLNFCPSFHMAPAKWQIQI